MKVLLDQNISFRLIPLIQIEYFEISHIFDLGWVDWNDFEIFKNAKSQQFDLIITLDEDFNNIILEHKTPPKIIWLKIGNCKTSKIASILNSNYETIKEFVADINLDCLEIYILSKSLCRRFPRFVGAVYHHQKNFKVQSEMIGLFLWLEVLIFKAKK